MTTCPSLLEPGYEGTSVTVYRVDADGNMTEYLYGDMSPTDALINAYICESGEYIAVDMHEPAVRAKLRSIIIHSKSGKTLLLGDFMVMIGGAS